MPPSDTFIQHSSGSPNRAVRQEKEIKGIWIRNEEINLSMFVDDIILYIKILSTPPKMVRINEFSTVTENKRNIGKISKNKPVFLCTKNEVSVREIFK